MSASDDLARATVRIALQDGRGEGSGFHFLKPSIIVTNAHVAAPLITSKMPMFAHAETGERWSLTLSGFSPPDKFDYAIMTADGANFATRVALKPEHAPITARGRRILYAGYPHGIDPLIVASSEVTSLIEANRFCFAGMIHGGNSGGPIVDPESLMAVGFVTKRRFFGDPEMRQIDDEVKKLQIYLESIQAQGSVRIMGVNFTEFASMVAKIANITNDLIRLNSTTGIGVGYPIEPLVDQCKALGLLA